MSRPRCVGDSRGSSYLGVGSPVCNTLWETADALEEHLATVHGTTYEEATRYVPPSPLDLDLERTERIERQYRIMDAMGDDYERN